MSDLGGAQEERRRVSVLFIDAVGSTSYGERTDPEAVRRQQIQMIATVRRVVRQYGGVVEKYIGDAAMVLFGAPVSTETDAVRCVRAGLDLQRALARENAGEGAWTFRVGIATGEALVDVGAAHDGGQSIVAGDVVNTAARLQSEAPHGGVLVCRVTHAATRTEIRYSRHEDVVLRGRTAPTEVWLAEAPLQRQLDQANDDSPMVGREQELGLLVNALHYVIRERMPRLVTMLGRAGIGKSRLVRELYQHVDHLVDVKVTWRSGRCPPFGENVAYAALADIVKAQAGVLDTDPPTVARERLDASLRDLAPPHECERLSDALRPLIGLPGSPLSTEDAESAWRRYLLALASCGPTVLVFEDLHWADERMLRFIELLSTTVRDVPLLVVCTARPELLDREPSWAGAMPGMFAVSLTPLRDESMAKVYAHMFGEVAFPAELLRPLLELADGMPLYAQEFVRMLRDQGTLRQHEHTWVMDGGDLPMPESVHAVIANRIDLLDPGDRGVLQAAAVVGARFWPGALAAALRTNPEVVDRALRRLAQRDLVREQPDSAMADEVEYAFRHVLVSDVCYERLPRAERIARHLRTADWLEARSDARGGELANAVAHHRYTAYRTARELGQDTTHHVGPALHSLRQAARRATMLNAFDAATSHVTRAQEMVGLGSRESDQLGVDLLTLEVAFHRDGPAFQAGDGPERLAELADRLYKAGDQAGAARAWTILGQLAWLRADRPTALHCLDRAVELFDNAPAGTEKAQAYAELARLHMLNYENEPAIDAAQVAAEIADRFGMVELKANTMITLATCRYQGGEPDALIDLQEALDFCRTHQLPSLRRAAQNVAYALREEGDRARSDRLLAEVSSGTALVTDYSVDAMLALFAGDWDRFFTVADPFLETPTGQWDLQIRLVRGWMRAYRREPDTARDDLDRALVMSRESGFHRLLWTALAHGALGRAVLGDTTEAVAMLTELATGWRAVRTIASGEWAPAAGHAAALLGPQAAGDLRALLRDVPHQTPWSTAALATVEGEVAAGEGDTARAVAYHLDAAERYQAIGSLTDRALSLAAAVRAGAGSDLHSEVIDFAARNRATLLLP